MDDLLTTKQLQDLLRVDRITIYRMLNDGRLSGFKLGGQWRFPRREIAVWLQEQQSGVGWASGPCLPVDGPLPFSQVLPLGCIRAIQVVCAEAMGIALVTTDMNGAPLSGVSNACDFCTLILATERGQIRCSESWRQQPDGQVRSCHAGYSVRAFRSPSVGSQLPSRPPASLSPQASRWTSWRGSRVWQNWPQAWAWAKQICGLLRAVCAR